MQTLETLADIVLERYGPFHMIEIGRLPNSTMYRLSIVTLDGPQEATVSKSLDDAVQTIINRLTNSVPPINPVP